MSWLANMQAAVDAAQPARLVEEPGQAAPPCRRLRDTDTGQEKLCTKCDEWWPADIEFFYASGGGIGKLSHCCKACYEERRGRRRGPQVPPVPLQPTSLFAIGDGTHG